MVQFADQTKNRVWSFDLFSFWAIVGDWRREELGTFGRVKTRATRLQTFRRAGGRAGGKGSTVDGQNIVPLLALLAPCLCAAWSASRVEPRNE